MRDNGDRDKDGAQEERSFSRDQGIRFTTFGKISLEQSWSQLIQYNLNFEAKSQKSYQRRLYSGGGVTPYSFAYRDSIYESSFYPNEYYGATAIEGKPVNFFFSVSDISFLEIMKWKHRLLLGADWKTDSNKGKGRYFETGEGLFIPDAQRPRNYSSIPALHQFSLYVEDLITGNVFDRELLIQAGFRFDNIQPISFTEGEFSQVLLPRVNVAYQLHKKLSLRGGYGITSKAPALIYLYPDKAYFDPVSYQNYSVNYPDENLLIVTTKVFDCDPETLKPAENRKLELGF